MTKEEAEASGNMIAGLVVSVMREFNSYNIEHGGSGFAKEGEFWDLIHFSVKRLSIKYASTVDEDTYDAVVILGAGGYIGYNSWRVYMAEKRSKGFEAPKKETNGVQQPAPTAAPEPTPERKGGLPRRFEDDRREGNEGGYY